MKKSAVFIAALLLFCAAAFAEERPSISVYVTGDAPDNEKKALGTRMLASLVTSERYRSAGRANSFIAEVENEQARQRGRAMDDSRISEIGRRFGVDYVCVVEITPAFGEFQVSARIVDAATAEVAFIGESASPLKSMADLARVSDQVAANMFKAQARRAGEHKPEPAYAHAPEYGAEAAYESAPTPEPEPEPAAPEGGTPKLAVYITSDNSASQGKDIGARILAGLVGKALVVVADGLVNAMSQSGKYNAVNLTGGIRELLEKDPAYKPDKPLSAAQIKAIGKHFGVRYLCVVKIIVVDVKSGSFNMEVQFVNAATGATVSSVKGASDLKNKKKMIAMTQDIVRELAGGAGEQVRETEPAQPIRSAPPVAASAPEPDYGAGQEGAEPAIPRPEPAYAAVSQERAAPTMTQPGPAYAAPPEPEPRERAEFKISAGGGLLFANSGGGGMEWGRTGEKLAMPYGGYGAYVFLDAVYAEAFAGFSTGGGKWESGDVPEYYPLPDMQRSYVCIGAFAKYPFAMGDMELFPLIGLDYEFSMSEKLAYGDHEQPLNSGGLSALWFKFGGGADVGFGQNLYLRAELLYGWRTANAYEEERAKEENYYYGTNAKINTRLGHGITLKVGAGLKF